MSHGASSPSRARRRAFLAQRGQYDTAPVLEVVHVAATDGRTCVRCLAQLCGSGHSYAPGDRVTVYENDPLASWLTSWPPSCGRGRLEGA